MNCLVYFAVSQHVSSPIEQNELPCFVVISNGDLSYGDPRDKCTSVLVAFPSPDLGEESLNGSLCYCKWLPESLIDYIWKSSWKSDFLSVNRLSKLLHII